MDTQSLYPVFLKLAAVDILLVGGGTVAAEKLRLIQNSSPNVKIWVVAREFQPIFLEEVKNCSAEIYLLEQTYTSAQLNGRHIVIAATDDQVINKKIYEDAQFRKTLVHVVGSPELSNFDLGETVTKGDLNVAFFAKGKPAGATRKIKQFFEEILPDNVDELLMNLGSLGSIFKKNQMSEQEEITRSKH